MQFKTHSRQLHTWCSGASVFFTHCQESKPANPLRFEVVCTFPSEFHWGFTLCYLAHASHPAESKCSQSKVRWRQRLCRTKLEKAGEREGLEGRSTLILSEMIHITGLATLRSSHLRSLPSPSGNTKQILLTSVWPTRRAVAEGDGQPVHDSFSLSTSRSLSSTFFLHLSPSHSLKTAENKGRHRRKAI